MKVPYAKYPRHAVSSLMASFVIVLLSACSVTSVAFAQSLNQNNQSPTGTIPMPPTQTDCPADGTARAAVMRPLALGKHANIVYIYNEVPPNTSTAFGHLKRYDVNTHQKTFIVTSGLSILSAQVSADGQWILFLSQPDPRGDPQHVAMLQLVRMDGQGLQTLYCISGPLSQAFNQPTVQWSTDQKSILLTVDTNDTTSTITLLDVASGKLTTELAITDNQQLYRYSVLTWLDTKRAYVLRSSRQAPPPPVVLYIMDIRTNRHTDGSDLQKVLEHPIRFTDLSMDSSYDASKLFVSSCLEADNPFDTTISVGPATGGTFQTIYHPAPTICVEETRAVQPDTLLMVAEVAKDQNLSSESNQVWTMKPDGSARRVLFNTIPQQPGELASYQLNQSTQFPWSNVSRDGGLYSLRMTNNITSLQELLIGSIHGGAPTEFAYTGRGSIYIAGWTTM